jgi:type I restriction enzyme S subunit
VSLSNYRCTPSATKPNYAPNSGLREGLHRLYGDRLRGILLYGSFARGEAGGDSDVDVLVVLDGIEGYAAEVDRTGELVSRLSLKYGVSISRAFVEERDWIEKRTPFLDNMRVEAVALGKKRPRSCWTRRSSRRARGERSIGSSRRHCVRACRYRRRPGAGAFASPPSWETGCSRGGHRR